VGSPAAVGGIEGTTKTKRKEPKWERRGYQGRARAQETSGQEPVVISLTANKKKADKGEPNKEGDSITTSEGSEKRAHKRRGNERVRPSSILGMESRYQVGGRCMQQKRGMLGVKYEKHKN